ncbi:MAG: 1-deoxy-D-xylulose-5-phosphate reductoisomerase, partial [Clostridia bacterium]|nr:1-deoxy-D-xylulose-5-phosphate reductoisomerase [Clostridia bacterium]
TFECLRACKRAMAMGGTATAVANGANEEAVRLFLERKIGFLDIGRIVYNSLDEIKCGDITSLDDVLDADTAAREYVKRTVK